MMYKNKLYLKEILDELEKLGYFINYSLMNANDYEVPQNRERVIVIGSKKKNKFPKKINRKVTSGEALVNWLLNLTKILVF